jgi:hypothetical protein
MMQPVEIAKTSRPLFMKYALPCAGTLVKRGKVRKEYIDELIDAVKSGKEIPAGAEKIFAVAFAACSLLAKDKGKDIIDDEIIHEYFLSGHDTIIEKRYEEMGDFDKEACRVCIGTVESKGTGKAEVKTKSGSSVFRTDFAPSLKKGDSVITHWDFIVEKTDNIKLKLK